jgi:hypothetical protein
MRLGGIKDTPWIAIKMTIIRFASNQALERTTARRVFTFQMIKTDSVAAALALGGGRSAYSR